MTHRARAARMPQTKASPLMRGRSSRMAVRARFKNRAITGRNSSSALLPWEKAGLMPIQRASTGGSRNRGQLASRTHRAAIRVLI